MAEIENSKQLSSEDSPDDILEEDIGEGDFEENDKSLSLKQKILLSLSGCIGLFIFVLSLFPVEDILHYYITKNIQSTGFIVDFKKLNFPILGTKSVDSLYVVTKDNIEIKSEEVQFSLDLSEFYNGNILSNSEIYAFSIETDELFISSKSIQSDINLVQSERETPTYNGSISISSGAGKIVRITSFPVLGDLSGTSIKSITLNLKKNGSRISFEKAFVDLSIAKIQLKGRLDLSPNFRNSRLDMEICPKLSKEFSSERQDISDMLTLVARDGKEPCIPLQGTISSPLLNINMNLPGSESQPNSLPATPP
jgi:hypothetical protein